jgi:hypothetical protein
MAVSGAETDILIPATVLFGTLYGLFQFAFGPKRFRRSRSRVFSYRSRNFGGERNWGAKHSDNFQDEQGSAVQHFGRQLQSVMISSFEKRRIMNASEYRTFRTIEDEMAAIRKGHRVFAQTCLGEILQSKNEDAFYSINSKRVDILIVDQCGWPVLAVEYQGEGHFKGTAAARDAIKKEALRKAGIRYLEVVPEDSDEQIRRRVRENLGFDSPPTNRTTSPQPHSPPASPSPARTGFGLRTASH